MSHRAATEGWEDSFGRHSDSSMVVAINGSEEVAVVHGERLRDMLRHGKGTRRESGAR